MATTAESQTVSVKAFVGYHNGDRCGPYDEYGISVTSNSRDEVTMAIQRDGKNLFVNLNSTAEARALAAELIRVADEEDARPEDDDDC
jgi:hypothetical protein